MTKWFVASEGQPVQHFLILGPHEDLIPQRAFGSGGWRGRRRGLDVKLIHLRCNYLTEVLNIDSEFYFRESSINFDSAIPICPNQVLAHLRLGIPNHIVLLTFVTHPLHLPVHTYLRPLPCAFISGRVVVILVALKNSSMSLLC